MTVRRLAQTPGLGLTLVAGRDGGDRPIGWAHAIELEDPTPYLSGGELVMTTGMRIGSTDDEHFAYLARLSAAGIAALAFDTGTTHEAVPAGIIAAGDAVGLPVLSVPADTPFIAITRAIIDEITADQLHSVQRVVSHQEVLARETLRNGIPAVVDALSKLLSATVVVVDLDSNILAANGTETDHIGTLSAQLIASSGARSRTRQASRVIADGDGYCTLQALRAAEPVRGYVAIKTDAPLSPTDRLLVSHAVSLISIEIGKPMKVLDAEQRLRTAVTHGLLTQPPTIDDGVLRYFGFDADAEVVALVLADVGPRLTAETTTHQVLAARHHPYLACSRADDIVVILPATERTAAQEIRHDVGAQLQRRLRGGLSLPCRLDSLATAVNQARTATSHARSQADSISDYAELGLFDLILGTRSVDDLVLISQRIAPLADHDGAQATAGDGLLGTLDSYLRHNGHVESASAALGVHRHTMRNRITKIAALVGCDLHDADVRAELLLAIRARELLSIGRH